jgi:hypothetical protein
VVAATGFQEANHAVTPIPAEPSSAAEGGEPGEILHIKMQGEKKTIDDFSANKDKSRQVLIALIGKRLT